MTDTAAELAQFQDLFDAVADPVDTPREKPKREWIPPFKINNTDTAMISECSVGKPPWPNDEGLYLRITLLHEIKDQSVTIYWPLTPKSIAQAGFVKQSLMKIGYDLDNPATQLKDLASECANFEGKLVEVFTKPFESKNGTKYNHYLNKILGDSPSMMRDDPDIPF